MAQLDSLGIKDSDLEQLKEGETIKEGLAKIKAGAMKDYKNKEEYFGY